MFVLGSAPIGPTHESVVPLSNNEMISLFEFVCCDLMGIEILDKSNNCR